MELLKAKVDAILSEVVRIDKLMEGEEIETKVEFRMKQINLLKEVKQILIDGLTSLKDLQIGE